MLWAAPGAPTTPGPTTVTGKQAPAKTRPASTAKNDWSDLEDNEFKLFGSDKERKLPISLKPIAEIEDWTDDNGRDHYSSYKLAWLFYWTIKVNNYPKFTHSRFLLFSHLESKIDNRRRTYFFPLYFNQRDGDEELTITPLSLHFYSNREEYSLVGPIYNYSNAEESRRYILPLIFYGEKVGSDDTFFGLAPLYYHSYAENEVRKQWNVLTPLFYMDRRKNKKDDTTRTFSISPLHYYNSRKDEVTFGFPVLPLLFFRHRLADREHYNMALAIDFVFKDSALDRAWLFPFLFYQRGKGGYLHAIPPLYISFDNEETSYTHLVPLYLHYKTKEREIKATPISFYGMQKENGVTTVHENYFWLFDRVTDDSQGEQKLRRLAFVPFFFYSPGPERYLHVLPPLYVSLGQDDWAYRHILPLLYFHYHDAEGSVDVIPTYVVRKNKERSHHNFLALVDWERRQGKFSRFWAIPFWFYEPDSYNHILPPLYVSLQRGTSGYRHLFPFFLHGWDDESSLFFAWLYTRYRSRGDTHHNVAGLFHQTYDEQGLSRFWVMPFYFSGRESYRHILPPLYFSSWDKTSFTAFGPLYYYNKTNAPVESTSVLVGPVWRHSEPQTQQTNTHLLPIWFQWSSPREFSFFFTPLLSYGSSIVSEERSLFTIYSPLWFYDSDTTKTKRDWSLFAWIYYGERHTRQAQAVGSVPPRDGPGSAKVPGAASVPDAGGPPASEKTSPTVPTAPAVAGFNSEYAALDVSPLWVHDRQTTSIAGKPRKDSRFWFPILPVFYRSYNSDEGAHYNAAYLADWSTDATGSIKRFWFFPLAFYGRDDYLHILPFLFHRPFGYNAEEGWSGGLTHFHSWSKQHDRLWFLLFYNAHDERDNSATTLLLPLYYNWQREDSKGSILLPFRVTYEDKQKYVNIWFFGGSSSRSTGALTANVGQSNKGIWYVDVDYSLFYNLFSVAYRKSIFAPDENESGPREITGPGQKAGTVVTKKPGDAPSGKSVAVNTAGKEAGENTTPGKGTPMSPAARANEGPIQPGQIKGVGTGPSIDYFRKIGEKVDEATKQRRAKEAGLPSLTKNLDITRETARDFWGFTALFGVLSYQAADTQRHFRLLPFAYLTWDTKYENDLTVIPPVYLNYEREDLAYTIAFLFYGHQRTGKSYINAYGIFGPILYMNEYDDETKEKAHSVLWPFVRWYSGPDRDGFRVFPLVWNRNTHEKGKEHGRSLVVFPLLYHTSTAEQTPEGKVASAFKINPFLLHSSSETPQRESEFGWVPILPLYIYGGGGERIAGQDPKQSTMVRSNWSASPLHLTYSEQTTTRDSGNEKVLSSSTSLLGLPLLYYNRSRGESADSHSSTFFLLGFYNYSDARSSEQSFLYGLFRRENEFETKASSFSLLYGLVHSSSEKNAGSTWLLPFYYGSHRNPEGAQAESTWAIPLLLTWRNEVKLDIPGQDAHDTFFFSPLYVSSHNMSRSNKREDHLQVFPLLPLPFLYRSQQNQLVEWNWLGVFKWQRDGEGPTSWRVFPFLFYESGENASFTLFPLFWRYRNEGLKENALHLLPPVFMSWDRPDGWTYFLAGLYLDSTPYSSRQNFLYLIDRRVDKKAEEYTFGMIFDFFRIRGGHQRRFELDIGYGLLFGYDRERTQTYDWNLLWMQAEQRPGRYEFHFLPFWWYGSREFTGSKPNEKIGTEWSLWLLPLTYINVDTRPHRGDTFFLFGGIYIRSEDDYSRQNFYFLLDHINDRRAEREKWGLLFHSFYYETTKERTKGGMAFRLLGGFDYRSPSDYDFNVLWYIQYRDQQEFHSSFIPLWYYSSDMHSSVLVVPPLLTYASRDRGGLFQLVGLGSVWYRNYDASTLSDSQRVLLGAAYEYEQRAENGYSAVGSVWGFLWQYQKETETGYRKFSILKLPIYKRIEHKGTTRSYIMGIPTD